MLKVCRPRIAVVVALLFSPCIALAQASLALSSSSAAAGGAFSLNLSLSSLSAPAVAGLQWTLNYPVGINNLVITAGPSLTAAGKSLTCSMTTQGYECVATGQNQNVIANGLIATVSATVSGSAAINITGAVAAASNGTSIPITATGGQVSSAAAVTITSVACNPASLGPGASAGCTVTLSGPAGPGGANVSLGATGGIANSVNSLVIGAGSSTGTFTTTAGQFKSDQSATVTASFNGATTSTTIALAALPLVSSLQCAAAGLSSNSATTCTVTLSKAAAAGGTSVAISASVNNVLTMPASGVVPLNATSASFPVSVGSITANQSVTLIATLNGSVAITALSLTAPVAPSSIPCAQSFLAPGGSTTCTVTLSGPAGPGGANVSLGATGAIALAANSLAIGAGSNIGTFTATAGQFKSDQSATVTASLNGVTASATIALATLPLISSLQCGAAGLSSNSATTCTVTLSKAAPAGGASVAISASVSNVLTMPASAVIPQSATSASFSASVGSITSKQSITIIAMLNGSVAITALSLTAPATPPASAHTSKSVPSSQNGVPTMSADASPATTALVPIGLSCDHPFLGSGHRLTCEAELNRPATSDSTRVSISSSGRGLTAPATVGARAGQRRVRFEVEADAAALEGTAVLEAHVGSASVQHSIALLSSNAPNLLVPAEAAGKPGSAIAFTVTASDPQGLDVHLAASGLPPTAVFDPESGVLQWTPTESDLGVQQVEFTAANALGASITKSVKIYVDSGLPVISKLENGAGAGAPAGCSPGSVATIRGRSLFTGTSAASDPAGSGGDLGGTRVLVNGVPTAVLFASSSRVDLLCPAIAPGTPLGISVETAAGKSNELQTSMRESAPGLFTINGAGTGQALAMQDGSLDLAAIPNARYAAKPALADDMVAFRATGIDCDRQTAARLSLKLGTYLVPAAAATPAPGYAGVCEITARIPSLAGDAIPVTLIVLQSDGQEVVSNEGTIGVTSRQ